MSNPHTQMLLKALPKNKIKASAAEKDFFSGFYSRISATDAQSLGAELLFDNAQAHYKLGFKRKAHQNIIGHWHTDPTDGQPNGDTMICIVCGDRPFLVDTLTLYLNQLGARIKLIHHPLFSVQRNKKGEITDIDKDLNSQRDGYILESFVQVQLETLEDKEIKNIIKTLHQCIDGLRCINDDWPAMRGAMAECTQAITEGKAANDKSEYEAMTAWFENHHFALLGYCELESRTVRNKQKNKIKTDNALGLCRHYLDNDLLSELEALVPPIVFSRPKPVIVTKAAKRVYYHRNNYMDTVLIAHGDGKSGNLQLSCFFGFLANNALAISVQDIPHVRQKVAYSLQSSQLRPGGHGYKSLQTIMENLPRALLFQLSKEDLVELATPIHDQQGRRYTNVLLHQDTCGHFHTCLVYVPRELFNSRLRSRIQSYLTEAFAAQEVTFNVYFTEANLTRIDFSIHGHGDADLPQESDLQQHIAQMCYDWSDSLNKALQGEYTLHQSRELLERYQDAFSQGFQDEYNIKQAITDIRHIEALASNGRSAMLYQRDSEQQHQFRLRIYSDGSNLSLSDVLPVLENMGVLINGERPFTITTSNGHTYSIREYDLQRADQAAFDVADMSDRFLQAFGQILADTIENDGFNKLILGAGLAAREVMVLRAIFRYLKQIRLRYSQTYVIESLNRNGQIASAIFSLFAAKFEPNETAQKSSDKTIRNKIKRLMSKVESLDDDRILNAMLDIINACVRTNYYQPNEDGTAKDYLSLKLLSANIPRIPQPAPKFEIFVYSPRVEGVHLRFGNIARGGLRWSDRGDDFRTEVLGLVKAQQVKNAVIVPVGSKGGFVPKHLPKQRDAMLEEGIACYRIFINGLLDITDNIVANSVKPPQSVVRHDADDPYLVVAADKGTAAFSDIANGISADHDFWLGDAFASGGSAGYDHKKMGITARGAWESVKRHFREMDKDIQSTDFTVAGVGDMGGDVFGNGMLLSKHIRLIAAFNHMHIFIDPTPDAAKSYAERKRLFELPRSSWEDYNTKLLSKGGAIFQRSAKSITISKEAQDALGASSATFTPDELINAILRSPVELLWNGGIGTYVKASSESHDDAQDKANDGLRVDANELACKVIGEGGNLGMTQLARIEFDNAGGHCYSDAIDNSAGVDSSDHEVNLKVLLNGLMRDGKLTLKRRNKLLEKMEEEVAELCLRNNYRQTQTVSIHSQASRDKLNQQISAIQLLEESGQLNREIEFLPDDEALEQRMASTCRLTRPELAVLLAYSKMDLYQSLLDSKLVSDDYLFSELVKYFPKDLAKRYEEPLAKHQLRAQIIATHITNTMIDRMGPAFHLNLSALLGVTNDQITRCYLAAREILSITHINLALEALDNKMPTKQQYQLLEDTSNVLLSNVVWLLINEGDENKLAKLLANYQSSAASLQQIIAKAIVKKAQWVPLEDNAKREGLPSKLSTEMAALPAMNFALDIIHCTQKGKKSLDKTAQCYFEVANILHFHWLTNAIDELPVSNRWHERSRFSLKNQHRGIQSRITQRVLATKGGLTQWQKQREQGLSRIAAMADELRNSNESDFAMMSVMVNELERLI